MAPRKTATKKTETKKTETAKAEPKKASQKSSSQKGIDKEYIFNLIMPTTAEEEEELEQLDEGEPEAAAPAQAKAKPQPQAQEEEEPDEDIQDSLSLLREKLNKPIAAPVQLRPAKNLVVVNLVEQLVADRLDSAFDKFNCCRCDKCRRDVAALALNALPPQYVVAEPEDIPGLLAKAPAKDIPSALVKAILQIKNNPQH